jgi:uncharacterized repeat protein (TIGR01451 family)
VTKTTSTPTVAVGATATYTVTVTAGGDANATGVALTDVLPSGLAWTVGGANAASCSPASPVAGGTTLTCNFGAMTRGTSRTITLSATVGGASCPAIANRASVTAVNDRNAANDVTGPVVITVDHCSATRGFTVGFWHNQNGHAILDPDGDGRLAAPVAIGGAARGFTVQTIAESDRILSNDACSAGSPVIFPTPCTLSKDLGLNTLENLAAQTLALAFNVGRVAGYGGQTLAGLGCGGKLTSALTAAPVSLSAASTVGDVLAAANRLINGSKGSGTTTEAQAAAMNGLLGGCVNRE